MERSIVVFGLPGSGKTTFLAALWHLVTARDVPAGLTLDRLDTDVTHLNALAARWRQARVQARTVPGGERFVSMRLRNANGVASQLTFPDISGEVYSRMWEERDCDKRVADLVRAGNVLLFIHGDTIRMPQWVLDVADLARTLGLPIEANGEVPWHPRLAPTQVQIVDLLQLLRTSPLDVGPRRLAIVLSAWDKLVPEGLTPDQFLTARLPMLSQYLANGADQWSWRVWGISAQGGDYDDPVDDSVPPTPEAQRICDLNLASERILVLRNGAPLSHDLTEPVRWLME
jgi:hypothetical protein